METCNRRRLPCRMYCDMYESPREHEIGTEFRRADGTSVSEPLSHFQAGVLVVPEMSDLVGCLTVAKVRWCVLQGYACTGTR